MRNNQKRMRGRNNNNNNNNNHRKSQNPLTRVYESNGPDVKIRGTASHIAEKYMQLARDAQGSGDPVAAENYFQHAEHYFRLIAAAQEQFRQQNPYYNQQPQPAPHGAADENYDEEEGDGQPAFVAQQDPGSAPQPPQGQPFMPRDAQQPYPQSRPQPQPAVDAPQEGGGLPAFITGGQPQPSQNGNGQEQGGERPDRFGRRRRRHRNGGYRSDRQDFAGGAQDAAPSEGGNSEPAPQPE